MNRDDVIAAIVVADKIRAELNDDYVGVWKVVWHLRRALPNATDGAVHELSEAVLGGLISLGAVLGDIDGATGSFIPWPSSGSLDAAMEAWRVMGREPSIGDIGWIARSW